MKPGAQFEMLVLLVLKLNGWIKPFAEQRFNCVLPGKRQPGRYEVDIFIATRHADGRTITEIWECKDLKRRVSRPYIQNLINTREAVAVGGAGIAARSGFTKEALAVAEAAGMCMTSVIDGKDVGFDQGK